MEVEIEFVEERKKFDHNNLKEVTELIFKVSGLSPDAEMIKTDEVVFLFKPVVFKKEFTVHAIMKEIE